MISDETKRKLRELNLDEFIQSLEDQENLGPVYNVMPFYERLDIAIDATYTRKRSVKAKRLLKYAKLRFPDADVNTIYYADRGLDRNKILELSTGKYFYNTQNIIINGFTGSGKTHLACALGKEACRQQYRTRYIRMPELLEMLNLAEQAGSGISRKVTTIANYQLLIVDEWLTDIPSEKEQKYLLEIFEKRYDRWPTIFCTQYKHLNGIRDLVAMLSQMR